MSDSPPPPADSVRSTRIMECYVDVQAPGPDPAVSQQIRLTPFAPTDQPSLEQELAPFKLTAADPPDPRSRCKQWATFLNGALANLEPHFTNVLQQAGYPPATDPAAHPAVSMEEIYPPASSPYSVVLVYWYTNAAPCVVGFPEVLMPRVSDQFCEVCDPTGSAKRALRAQLDQTVAEGRLTADEATLYYRVQVGEQDPEAVAEQIYALAQKVQSLGAAPTTP